MLPNLTTPGLNYFLFSSKPTIFLINKGFSSYRSSKNKKDLYKRPSLYWHIQPPSLGQETKVCHCFCFVFPLKRWLNMPLKAWPFIDFFFLNSTGNLRIVLLIASIGKVLNRILFFCCLQESSSAGIVPPNSWTNPTKKWSTLSSTTKNCKWRLTCWGDSWQSWRWTTAHGTTACRTAPDTIPWTCRPGCSLSCQASRLYTKH